MQGMTGTYLFESLYGALFGIIAGPMGIRLSGQNNLSQSSRFCLWRAFIPLITVAILGSAIGLSIGIYFFVLMYGRNTRGSNV